MEYVNTIPYFSLKLYLYVIIYCQFVSWISLWHLLSVLMSYDCATKKMQMSEALAFSNPSIKLIWGNLRRYFQFGPILKKNWTKTFFTSNWKVKGQIKPKANWRAVDSPKKRTNEFVLFAFLLLTANKTDLFVNWENLRRPNCFRFYLTFSRFKW